jgi:hypothetical protein
MDVVGKEIDFHARPFMHSNRLTYHKKLHPESEIGSEQRMLAQDGDWFSIIMNQFFGKQ